MAPSGTSSSRLTTFTSAAFARQSNFIETCQGSFHSQEASVLKLFPALYLPISCHNLVPRQDRTQAPESHHETLPYFTSLPRTRLPIASIVTLLSSFRRAIIQISCIACKMQIKRCKHELFKSAVQNFKFRMILDLFQKNLIPCLTVLDGRQFIGMDFFFLISSSLLFSS